MTTRERLDEIGALFKWDGPPGITNEIVHELLPMAYKWVEAAAAESEVEAASQAFKANYGQIDIRQVRGPMRYAIQAANANRMTREPKPVDSGIECDIVPKLFIDGIYTQFRALDDCSMCLHARLTSAVKSAWPLFEMVAGKPNLDDAAATRESVQVEIAKSVDDLQDEIEARIKRLMEALTPSVNTKAAYIGEFKFSTTYVDEYGEEVTSTQFVPWTTIKEIMKAILTRASPLPSIRTPLTSDTAIEAVIDAANRAGDLTRKP